MDLGRQLCADRGEGPGLVDHDTVVGPGHGSGDCFNVQRPDGPAVDHLALNPLRSQRLGCFQAEIQRPAEAHDRAVGPLPPNRRLSEGHQVVALRYLAFHREQPLRFEHKDGIVVTDGGLQETLGVVGVKGNRHFQPRHVGVHRLDAPGVGRAQLPTSPAVSPKHDRDRKLATRHVEHLRRVVENLVGRDQAERPAHELDDGPQAVHRSPDPKPREPVLGNRNINHTARSELLEHAAADLVRALILGHLLTQQKHPRVAAHLLAHRFADRFSEFDRSGHITNHLSFIFGGLVPR